MPRKVNYKNEFIAIDFETANSAYFSACAIGIVHVVGMEIVEKTSFLIQPPENYYNSDNIAIHGIHPDDTAQSDFFPAIWEKIKHYFNETYVVAHNASFDMAVLKSTLNHYNIEFPVFSYFCSIPVSGLNIPYGENISRTLEDRCKYYDVSLGNHHDALCDAVACAELVIYALKNSRYRAIDPLINVRVGFKQFSDVPLKSTFRRTRFDQTKAKQVQANVEVLAENADSDFAGKVFVFTGEVPGMPREFAYARVIAGGGTVADGVSKKVNVLVNADGRMSGKVKKALELQEKGCQIEIISGKDFLDMLNN